MAMNEVFLRRLGKRVDELRKERGFSFQELADVSDMEKSNLVRLTTRGSNITVNTLYNIAQALDVPLTELLDLGVAEEG